MKFPNPIRIERLLAYALVLTSILTPVEAQDEENIIARSPYLQNVTETSITIMWRTKTHFTGMVEYGIDSVTENSKMVLGGNTHHQITLEELQPGTTYQYRVVNFVDLEGEPMHSPTFQFKTAPDDLDSKISFMVIGDSGSGSAEQYLIRDVLLEGGMDLFLHSGDTVYPAVVDESIQLRFFDIYEDILTNTAFYPTMGNHDLSPTIIDERLFYLPDVFQAQFALPDIPREDKGSYYSFDYGAMHVTVVDSTQITLIMDDPFAPPVFDIPQLKWIEDDLRESDRPWKVVLFHHPPYSGGAHGGHLGLRNMLVPIFERNNVDLVINGHEHHYQRSHPILKEVAYDGWQGSSVYSPTGPIYVITGGGGALLYNFSHEEELRYMAHTELRHHAIKVQIEGDTLELQAVDFNEQIIDEFKIIKGPKPQFNFIRGDADASGDITISDPIAVLSYAFLGTTISCTEAADWDDNDAVEITDVVSSLSYQFLGEAPPKAPFPDCGTDVDFEEKWCLETSCK